MSDQPPVAVGYVRHFLKKPVQGVGAGDTVTSLTYLDVRMDVTGADMVATDRGEGLMAKQMHLIASLSGQPYAVILRMSQPDIEALMELSENPTAPGLQTGSAASG